MCATCFFGFHPSLLYWNMLNAHTVPFCQSNAPATTWSYAGPFIVFQHQLFGHSMGQAAGSAGVSTAVRLSVTQSWLTTSNHGLFTIERMRCVKVSGVSTPLSSFGEAPGTQSHWNRIKSSTQKVKTVLAFTVVFLEQQLMTTFRILDKVGKYEQSNLNFWDVQKSKSDMWEILVLLGWISHLKTVSPPGAACHAGVGGTLWGPATRARRAA